MATFQIGWHKNCLRNWRRSLQDMEAQLQWIQDRVQKEQADLAFYEIQISEAIRLGKTEFDRDRFCKKRKQSGPA